ncbi:MAG: RDD family protein [Clostridia bacterium]|nr:RDD family protein [Clostridia bacterium]
MNNAFKRILAFLIDWNVSLFPFILLFLAVLLPFQESVSPLIALFAASIIVCAMLMFVLRDIIFKNSSIGKRIFGLNIYDKITLQEATKKQKIIRNLFLFLYPLDGIVLLITGETIGDRIAGTAVHTQYSLSLFKASISSETPEYTKKKKYKNLFLVLVTVVCCLVAFIGFIQLSLNAQKDTEEYKLSYEYLISSNSLKQLSAQENDIRINQYSSLTMIHNGDDASIETVKIGFLVSSENFEIVCHNENGAWQVCEDCTLFE